MKEIKVSTLAKAINEVKHISELDMDISELKELAENLDIEKTIFQTEYAKEMKRIIIMNINDCSWGSKAHKQSLINDVIWRINEIFGIRIERNIVIDGEKYRYYGW